MRRKNAGYYFVQNGEQIAITVKPISVGPFIACAHNGNPVIDTTPDDRKFNYDFTISEAVGKVEVTEIAGQFQGDEPPTARYEITIGGDQGAPNSFAVRTMKRPTKAGFAELSRTLQLEVVS